MKRPDGSKSPTRKQLAKLAINYSKQMMQDKELDRPRSHKSRELKRTQPHQTSQKSSVVATKGSVLKDEVYVDQEHRDLKLHKLTHLMEVEVAKGEADGELDFKPENIEKAYTGYPQFMQRRNSQMLGTPERDRAASVDSQGRPVKPLIEDLKEALSKAKEVDSVETSQLNESSEVASFKHDSIAPRGASTTSPPSKLTLEEKLYYLEIKHIPEYTDSPMKERFDFHQRKSKEIRRVQYATYLDKTKNKPVLPKKSTLRDLFTEAPRMVPKREGSKEIIKREERMEVFFSNLPKMITDNSHLEQIKRGLPSRQPANEDAGLTHSFLRVLEPNQEARRPNFGRSYTAVPGSQNQRRTRQERARDGLPDAPAARIVASDFDPSDHSEGYRSIHSVADNQSEDGGSFIHRPLNRDDKHRHSVPNTSRGPQEAGRQSDRPRPSQPGASNLPLGPNRASNLTESEVVRSDAHPSRLQRSEDSLGKLAESEQDPAAYLEGSKATLDRVVNPLNQVPVSLTAGDGDNLADHLVPPILLDFDLGEPCEVDDTDRSMAHGDTLYGDDDEPNESLLLEPGLADAADSQDHDHSKVHSHDSEPEEDPELKANRADDRDSQAHSYRSVPDNRSDEPEPVSDGPSLKSNKADDPDSLSHSYRSVDGRSEEPEPASEEEEALPPIPRPSSKVVSKKEDYAYIKKVYARPRKIPEPEFAFKSVEVFRKTIDRQRTVIPRNLVRTEPSPERYTKKVETAYVKRTYDRPLIEPSPSRVEKSLERTYVHNVKVPVRAEPSPERYLKKEEQTYVKRVYERPRIEASPTRNEKKVEQTYIEAIRRQVRPDPSPERYTKKEETAYIHKVHARKVVEPLDQRIEKSVERAYRERVRDLVRAEPSPERYTKKEDSTYVKRVYQRQVVPAYEQRTEKSIERAYRERVKELVRPEPSPERYTKKEDALYVKRVYERVPVPPLEQRTEQSIERAYAKRVRELVRAEPSPERYAKQEEHAYIKKVYPRHAAPPLNQRFEKSIERAYARKVYDLARAEPSPERYQKKEEALYVTKVYKRIKNPPAPAFMFQKLEAWSIQRVYIRKRILPYIAIGKFETYRMVRTVLWQPDAETNSQDGGHDAGNIDAGSDYSEVKSAAHSSKGSHMAHDSDIGEDDHPSEGEEEQQIVYVYPAGEETESTRADKEADRMKQDSDDDHLSESSYDRYTRTAPYQKFPVWVLTPSENIPALISSPDGFIVDKETGKLEIRAGDNVILEPAPQPDNLTASKVHTTFEPIADKIRKPDPERDMKECDFIVRNPENSERVPVAVELRQRELEIQNTNCTLYDPHQKELGRAALTLVEATKPVEPEQEEKDQVYVPKLIHNAFLLDERDKVLDVLIKEEVLGGSVFLPHTVVESVINPVNPQNSKTFFRNESGALDKPNQKPSRLVESVIVDPKNPTASNRTKGISRSSIDPRSIKPEPGTVVETDYPITLKRSPNNCTEERVVREEIAIISNVPVRILTLDPNRSVIRNSQAKLDTLGVEPASETRETSKVVKRTQPELVFIPLDPSFKVLKSKILDEEPASAICNNGEEYRGSILVEKVTDPKTGDKNLEVFILVDPDLRKSQLGAEDKPKYVQVDLDDTTKKDLKEYADLKEGIHDLVKPAAPKPKEPVVPKRNLGLDQLDLRLVDAKGRELRVNILEKGNAPEDPDDSIVENYENVYNSEDLYYQLEYGGRQIEPSQVQKPSPRPEQSHAKKGMLFSNLKPNKAAGDAGKGEPQSAAKSLKDSRISSSRAAGYTPSGSKALPTIPQDRQTPNSKLQESKVTRAGNNNRSSKVGESGRPRSKSPRSYSDQVALLRTSAARSIALYWRYSNLKPIFRKIFSQKYEPVLKKFARQQRQHAFRDFLLSLFASRGSASISEISKAADEYLAQLPRHKA